MLAFTICALLASLILIALFSASEAALAATNRVRLRYLLRAQNLGGAADGSSESSAGTANELSDETQRFIATVTIAANIPVVIAAALTVALAISQWGFSSESIALSTLVALVSVSVLQIAPRLLVSQPGLKTPPWVKPARVLVAILRPLVGILMILGTLLLRPLGLLKPRPAREENEDGAGEEIRDLVEDMVGSSHKSGAGEAGGKELFESIFSFGGTRVHEVMIPRPDILALPLESTPDVILRAFEDSGFSRIPIHEGDIDRIAGILHVNDILKLLGEGRPDFMPRELMREPMFLPETMPIDEAFAAMRAARTHLALVMDEYGGTAGLLTIEDILEELVGEIADEHDRKVEEPLMVLDEHSAIADALLHIEDLETQWDLELPAGEFDTIGGFVIEQLGRAPVIGDRVEVPGAVLVVHALRGRRPHKIMITKTKSEVRSQNDE
jgi:CBS domain containing-hemolysin-like protein